MIKLNEDRNEFVVFSSKQHVDKTENLRIKIRSSHTYSSMSLKHIWLILGNILWIEKQVNSIRNSCYYPIRNIGFIVRTQMVRHARL